MTTFIVISLICLTAAFIWSWLYFSEKEFNKDTAVLEDHYNFLADRDTKYPHSEPLMACVSCGTIIRNTHA